ncbi:hypothetical protein cypCar_00003669, partial [Cyprinus carpio]
LRKWLSPCFNSHAVTASCFRWLVVKDSFVLYMRPEDGQVGTVILYDKGFHIKIWTQETGVRHGVTIEKLCRQVEKNVFVNAAGYFDAIAVSWKEQKRKSSSQPGGTD